MSPPSRGTAEVWLARLDVAPDQLALLCRSLDPAEQERAARFRFERDRRRFVAARGVLRQILGRYLGAAPDSLVFAYAPHGKPFLALHPGLHYNVSHAADLLLVAVAGGARIGVDVEQLTDDDVIDSVSGLVFSEPELAELRSLPPEERRRLFGELWTRKEAFIKADGRGMTMRLDWVDVLSAPGSVLLHDPGAGRWSAAAAWSVHPLPVPPGAAGALVVEDAECRIACFDWPADA